jgi:hypothetical protein
VSELKGVLIGDVGGKGVASLKFTVVDRMELGRIHLRNVAFLVVSDEPDAFSSLPPGYRGAIGIQVLVACRTRYWNSDGTVQLDGAPQRKDILRTLRLGG